jgi:hypothetical protein
MCLVANAPSPSPPRETRKLNGSKRPRRQAILWAGGGVVVIAALVVALVLVAAGGGPDEASLVAAASAANLRLTDLPQPVGWTLAGHTVESRSSLTRGGSCPNAVFSTSQAGVENDFAFDLSPSGSENAHLSATVVAAASAGANKKVRVYFESPRYAECLVRDVESSLRDLGGGLQVFSSEVQPLQRTLPLPGTATQVATLYQFAGLDRTMHTDVVRMYAGRLRINLWFQRCCPAFDRSFEESVLVSIAPRLKAEATRL